MNSFLAISHIDLYTIIITKEVQSIRVSLVFYFVLYTSPICGVPVCCKYDALC